MDKTKSIELIFSEWQASLKSRDRKKNSVRPNFEELFQRWKDIGADFNDIYEQPVGENKGISFLQRAIKAHLPISSVARASYKRIKQSMPHVDKTEKEFIEEWNKSIEDTATSTFFEFFPAPRLDEDKEPKVHGNMSAKEYKAQRRYAEQFPTLDTTELEKRWHGQQYNLDIEDLMKNILGKSDDDETNS